MADETINFEPMGYQADQRPREMSDVERRQRIVIERIPLYLNLINLKLDIDTKLEDMGDDSDFAKYYKDISDNLATIISRYFSFLINQESDILNVISNVKIPS